MNDITIAKSMYKHLNTWPDKPCKIMLEIMEKSPIAFSMALQQLSGTVVLKKYVNGSFTGAWPFAVYVRLSASDTAKKLDAVETLENLDQWMSSADLPDLGENRVADHIEMTALPSVAATYEDGSVDYQALFQLIYKQKE
ncbi:MAG: hypothetical protein IKN04_11385 [Clostridia bacterium]|nr:hypothetical protein [Clostridia bacterium]